MFSRSLFRFCQFTETEYATGNVENYLVAGGMPEVLKVHNEEQRIQLISDVINSTVKHDIVSRYNPSNPGLLYALIDFCRTAFSQELSVKGISNAVMQNVRSSRGGGASAQTTSSLVSSYIGYMQDVYFLYSPTTYSHRTKEILKRSVDKIYLGDLCMADFNAQTQKGRLLENMVYIEFGKKQLQGPKVPGLPEQKSRIDFFVQKEAKSALVQVCWQLGDSQENRSLWEREFGQSALYKKRTYPNLLCPWMTISFPLS